MSLKDERSRWEQSVVAPLVSKHPERKNGELLTASGIRLERLYTPEHVNGRGGDADGAGEHPVEATGNGTADGEQEYLERLGFPGEYPFTRGVQPTMYRGRYWTMRQYAGFGSAKETNSRFRYLLEEGQTGLSVAFDLPTQIGYDSDHSLCLGEVGKVGVAVDTLADMELLFDRIPLNQVSTSMTINAPAAVLLAMYVAVAEKQGVARRELRGTIQNDILKEYIARGTYIFPPEPSMRLITNTFRFCTQQMPRWNSISISGYHIREAGATAVQEIAFTLADAIAYVDAARSVGLDVDAFGQRLSFFFSAGSDLLEEVAKFRAARRMWARIMKERFGATSAKSQAMRFHAQTSGATLTAQQPDNNVVRVTLHALAAVLGGAQSLHTNSRDEALSLPTEDSVRIALRTQQIIANESGVANTVDPLAGSYAVEALTDELERRAGAYLARIDGEGGMVAAVAAGTPQREIEDAAYRSQRAIEEQERLIVGVNCHQGLGESCFDLMVHDQDVHDAQVERLNRVKAERDDAVVRRALTAVSEAAADDGADLMEPILEAVRQYATLGEVCGTLRERFGEYQQHTAM